MSFKVNLLINQQITCTERRGKIVCAHSIVSRCISFFLNGFRIHILLILSTTTIDIGKPPTKSMDIVSRGWEDTNRGVYKPNFLLLGLIVEHITHTFTYLETISFIWGQEKYVYNCAIIFPIPKWPKMSDVWASVIKLAFSSLGIEIFPIWYNILLWTW